MKNIKLFTLSLTILFLTNNFAHAQLWKKIQNQVEKKVEERVEKKVEEKVLKEVDKETEKALDEVIPLDSTDYEKNIAERMAGMSGMMGAMNVELPDKYDFDLSIKYKMTADGNENNIKYLFTDSGNQWGFTSKDDDNNMTMVIDSERDVVVMYMVDKNGKKTGQQLPNMMSSQFILDKVESELDESNFKIKKTGKTKKILGYKCNEYLITTEDGKNHIWTTSKLKHSVNSLFGKNKASSKYSNVLNTVDGAFLEMRYTDNKDSGNNSSVVATNIDKNPNSIKNDDYEWATF